MSNGMERQADLPLRKVVRIAWKNIKVRWWRSLLVTSGIILALAFLAYVLSSDALQTAVTEHADDLYLEQLQKAGVLVTADVEEQRAQTLWMASLALLISFVGILNAMIMSVTERFREIGTMKCLGALDAFIIRLYLIESLFQGILGTAVGMTLGFGLALFEGGMTYGVGEEMGFWNNPVWGATATLSVLKVLLFCFGCGLFLTVAGALYPAWRAAHMKPVDAMRAEV